MEKYEAVHKAVEDQPDDEIYQAMTHLAHVIEARCVGVRDIHITALIGTNRMTVDLESASF